MFASRFSRVSAGLILLVAAPIAVLYGTPQRRQSVNSAILKVISPRADVAAKKAAAAIRPIPLHAALRGAPYMSLRDGQTVSTNYVGDSSAAGILRSNSAQPLALASGDFDSDGVPDLVSGFSAGNAGIITIHRGNIDALFPYGAALRNGEPPAFLPNAVAIKVPEPPDFIGTGDFDADGHWDIVTAHLGSNSMYFLRGDGHGNFAAPQRIALSGNVTAFTTGEMNRADGLTDIVVGVTNGNGSQAVVYESPTGAIHATPETFSLPAPATSMVLGMIAGGPMRDLVIGAGNQLVVVHGRDRKLSLGSAAQSTVVSANVTHQVLPFSVKALALGHFSDTANLAALGDDGSIHLMQNSNALAQSIRRLSASTTAQPVMATHSGGASNSKPLRAPSNGTARAAERAALLQTMRQALAGGAAEWKVAATVSAPATAVSSAASLAHQFVSAHVSTSQYDDLLLLDNQASQVHVLSSRTTRIANSVAGGLPKTVSQPMSLAASLDVSGSPAAVLPMRVNQHGLKSLVMLQSGQSAPVVAQQTPANIFTVTNTLDITTSSLTAPVPAGSLRAALINAQNSGGSAEIVFNIPTSDPGYNAATGVFLIQPLSVVPPGNDNDFALPPSSETVTIDGYTQPGASPNTLTNGDNAKPVIQIDGGMALTPGGIALEVFDTVGAVIRGFIITGWSLTDESASPPTGGIGLVDAGVSDYIEGNFVGVDSSGVATKGNLEGVNISNGPVFGLTGPGEGGDIFGGTTPQARNILSGNSDEGIVAEPDSFFLQIQGNFIGTDRTGTLPVLNIGDGVFVPGEEVTVGGVLPGAGNLISANTNYNIDIGNGFPDNSAQNVTVQGNFIGTDVTGTVPLVTFASGIGIVNEADNVTVGGTTPSARNIISGNNFLGIEVSDDSFNVMVQGNYIGLDVTGTKAIGNGNGLTAGNNIPSGGVSLDTHTFSPPGTPVLAPPFNVAIGGAVAGSGNVISGNTGDGVSIMGFDNNDPNGFNPDNLSNFVMGNFIGTDVTGTNAVPNTQNGLYLLMDAEATSPAMNNAVGGTGLGAGNVISFNTLNGILIDGQSSGNHMIGNTIQHNGGTGVRIVTGTGNAISRNSIFGNGALGIDLGTAGPNANSNCQTTVTGANNSQNAPVLTAGSGTAFISATATDPNGNTSEFSNAVAASLSGNILTLVGNFNSLPSTTYTIEFFSSPSADSSGFGQGETYVSSTTVTTASTCAAPISNPVNLNDADISAALSFKSTTVDTQSNELTTGTDFGDEVYTAVVTNFGPATAHNVVLTDPLPATLQVSSTYCNLPTCQSPITTTNGTCSVSANTVTCNLGTLAPGSSATVGIPVQALATGSITNAVTAMATETDPNLTNNTASLVLTSVNPFTQVTQLVPNSLLTSSPDTTVIVSGTGLLPGVSTVTFTDPNGVKTVLPITAFFDNQTCGFNSNVSSVSYCQSFQVTLPHSLIGTAGAASFTINNPGASFALPGTFTLGATCTFSAPFAFTSIGDGGSGLGGVNLTTDPNVTSCTTTASSDVPWIVALDSPTLTEFNELSVDFAIAPNTGAQRTGDITFGGQTLTFTQDAGTGDSTVCTYTLTPPSATLSSAPGNFSVLVTPSAQSCDAFVSSYAPWITVNANSGLIGGTATVNYSVTANTGGPQTGSILIGPIAFPITQNAASTCFFTLSSNSANYPTAVGTGSVNVIASLPTCPWTATNNSPSFVTITSGASGTGNGTIQYSVAANSGGARNANITVANQAGASVAYAITQASLFACAAALSPATFNAPAEGASNGFLINLSLNQCSWNAISNNPTDLTITSSTSGTGSQAAIAFAVSQNPSTSPRTLTITAGCQTFTVIQAGAGAVTNPVPTITSLSPTGVAAGSGALTLTVNGTGFVSGATVSFGGANKTTTFVNSTQVTAAILASDVASVGTPAVVVTNPTPGGGASNSVNFNVTSASNPLPTISGLSPAGATAGSPAFTLTVNGTNFISSSSVLFGGVARTTTFVSATQLTAAILASDIASVGIPTVAVSNPTPGGGQSNLVNFSVIAGSNPVPTISNISPANAAAGSGAFTLTVTGTNFISSSSVIFNGAARTTTFVSATQLTAAILATDVASTGTPLVAVTNPTPGGGESNTVTFTITPPSNPVPTVTSLLPTGVAAGSGGFTLTVNGTNFVSGSVVNFGGANKTTAFVNSTQVTATILTTDVASAGTPAVFVNNPNPGGGPSNSVNFNVSAASNPVPTLTSISPNTVSAGVPAFTMTLTGTNFVSSSVVDWNGAPQPTTFVSATTLTATISAADVQFANSALVTVVNPAPGGGTSNSAVFEITTPVATLTSLVPNSAIAGGPAFTLTVNGSNFLSTAVVQWNGANLVTTFGSATQLTATVPATDIASVGTASVVVFNPVNSGGANAIRRQGEPAGTFSNALTFTITAANPVPTITSLSPASASAGSGAFTLTVNGTNYISSSVVQWNGSPRTTTFVSATKLTAAITAADIQTANIALVSVVNPTPGGGTSNVVDFNITTPIPVLASLAPSSATAGGAAFTLTLNGSNFINTSVAQWKGSNRTTTFVSSTQLTAAITAADIATAGTASVTVFTPTVVFSGAGSVRPLGEPSGITSNALTFTINGDFSVSATTTTQTVPAGSSGTYTIATAPIGGTFSGQITFSASGLPAGANASFSPSSVAAGSSTTMTITTTARGLAQVAPPSSPKNPARPMWLFTLAILLTLMMGFVSVAKFGRRGTRRLVPIGAFALLLISVGYISGCSGGGFPKVGTGGTPAGTFTVTVTGTSGSDVHSTTVTLNVQ